MHQGPSMSKNISTQRKKRPKVTSFTTRKKNMFMNVYMYVKETWPLDQYPYKEDLKKKTAEILGISAVTMSNVLREYKTIDETKPQLFTKEKHKFRQKVDNFDKCAIRKKIHSFYINGELPTIAKVFQAVTEDVRLPKFSRSTLRRVIRHLHFKFIKRHMIKALIDTDNIVLWRRSYLKKIKDYRQQNRQIFYIGVMCMNPGQTSVDKEIKKEKHGTNITNPTKFRQIALMHIGSEKGFIEGEEKIFECKNLGYYNTLAASHFEQWFENLLPKLGEKAVVVLDKEPYCSRLLENIPIADWSKEDIASWLQSRNITFDPNDAKIELLDKIKNVKDNYKQYVVDEFAKKFNVEILWLPQYHYDLSPIEFILADIQRCVDFKSGDRLEEIMVLLKKEMKRITTEKWRHYMERVIDEEDNYYSKIDATIDSTIDNFYTGVADSETESPESSEDDE